MTVLRAAGDATETLIEFRDYLPPGELLVMLAGKFRDDIRPLDELASEEFGRLVTAVGILVGRFTPFMGDPELITLLGGLRETLRAQSAERDRLQEEVTVS